MRFIFLGRTELGVMTSAEENETVSEPGGCPACGGDDFVWSFAKRGRDFWRCRGCGLERQHPLPSAEETRAYYENHYTSGRLRPMVDESKMSEIRAARRLDEVREQLPDGRWLDVGCSNGMFVAACRSRRIDAEGIELAEAAVTIARSAGLPVRQGTIEDHLPESPYDVVTAFDVLEHVPDPGSFIANARRLVRDDGRLAVSVPSLDSLARRTMGKHWYFYIPDGHLYYFGRRALRALLERHGFAVESVSTTAKPVTLRYGVTQLQVLNPWLARALQAISKLVPRRVWDAVFPLYLGEILVVARAVPSPSESPVV